MKRFVTAIAFSCVLSVSALAGETPSGGYAPPPPPNGQTQATSATAPGDVPTVAYTMQTSADLTLTLVETVFSLLSV